MSSNATTGVEKRARRKKRKRTATVAMQPGAQSALPGISDDVVIAQNLGKNVNDPTDLARLRAHLHRQGLLEMSADLQHEAATEGQQGQLEVVKWLHANGCPWDQWMCIEAAYSGQLEVIQWARAKGCLWNWNVCSQAALGGHLEVLQWLRENSCPWDKETCMEAARGGHLEFLNWAIANGCPQE